MCTETDDADTTASLPSAPVLVLSGSRVAYFDEPKHVNIKDIILPPVTTTLSVFSDTAINEDGDKQDHECISPEGSENLPSPVESYASTIQQPEVLDAAVSQTVSTPKQSSIHEIDGPQPGMQVSAKESMIQSSVVEPPSINWPVAFSPRKDPLIVNEQELGVVYKPTKARNLRRIWSKVKKAFNVQKHAKRGIEASADLSDVKISQAKDEEQNKDEDEEEAEEKIEEENEKEDNDRCQWDVINRIPLEAYEKLFLSLPIAANTRRVIVSDVTSGAYHFVVFMKVLSNSGVIKEYVIKVPGHGTPDRWTEEDEYMLNREVETVQLVRANTSIPVPEIIDFSSTINNPFGFPYIVMRRLSGQDASKIWYDQPYGHKEPDQITDFPSLETEKKRLTFLRSLAQTMTQLNRIEFASIGTPGQMNSDFSNFPLSVGKGHHWTSATDVHLVETREPIKSTQEYVQRGKADFPVPDPDENGHYSQVGKTIVGINKLLDIVLSHPVFQSKPGDTFVLQHDDLDLQNILTDDDGNITGIIDWDGSIAAPRCVGHAAVPRFLRRDWFPDSDEDDLIFRGNYYRDAYAAAMVEAGNPDAKYTTKSAIYQAVFAALYEGGCIFNITEKLLRDIPGCRKTGQQLVTLLASPNGWKLEHTLRADLYRILEPELPHTSLSDLFADLAAQAWMADFEGLPLPEEPGKPAEKKKFARWFLEKVLSKKG